MSGAPAAAQYPPPPPLPPPPPPFPSPPAPSPKGRGGYGLLPQTPKEGFVPPLPPPTPQSAATGPQASPRASPHSRGYAQLPPPPVPPPPPPAIPAYPFDKGLPSSSPPAAPSCSPSFSPFSSTPRGSPSPAGAAGNKACLFGAEAVPLPSPIMRAFGEDDKVAGSGSSAGTASSSKNGSPKRSLPRALTIDENGAIGTSGGGGGGGMLFGPCSTPTPTAVATPSGRMSVSQRVKELQQQCKTPVIRPMMVGSPMHRASRPHSGPGNGNGSGGGEEVQSPAPIVGPSSSSSSLTLSMPTSSPRGSPCMMGEAIATPVALSSPMHTRRVSAPAPLASPTGSAAAAVQAHAHAPANQSAQGVSMGVALGSRRLTAPPAFQFLPAAPAMTHAQTAASASSAAQVQHLQFQFAAQQQHHLKHLQHLQQQVQMQQQQSSSPPQHHQHSQHSQQQQPELQLLAQQHKALRPGSAIPFSSFGSGNVGTPRHGVLEGGVAAAAPPPASTSGGTSHSAPGSGRTSVILPQALPFQQGFLAQQQQLAAMHSQMSMSMQMPAQGGLGGRAVTAHVHSSPHSGHAHSMREGPAAQEQVGGNNVGGSGGGGTTVGAHHVPLSSAAAAALKPQHVPICCSRHSALLFLSVLPPPPSYTGCPKPVLAPSKANLVPSLPHWAWAAPSPPGFDARGRHLSFAQRHSMHERAGSSGEGQEGVRRERGSPSVSLVSRHSVSEARDAAAAVAAAAAEVAAAAATTTAVTAVAAEPTVSSSVPDPEASPSISAWIKEAEAESAATATTVSGSAAVFSPSVLPVGSAAGVTAASSAAVLGPGGVPLAIQVDTSSSFIHVSTPPTTTARSAAVAAAAAAAATPVAAPLTSSPISLLSSELASLQLSLSVAIREQRFEDCIPLRDRCRQIEAMLRAVGQGQTPP